MKKWTLKEVNWLKENYPLHSINFCCQQLQKTNAWATTTIARENGDLISIGNIEKGNKTHVV
jgi:hypothetical protein